MRRTRDQRKRGDLSFDITLKEKSLSKNVSKKSFLKSIMSNISKSLERFTGPKKINYEKEKNKFSKFLTDNLIPKITKAKIKNYFSNYEENLIEETKNNQINLNGYLNYIQEEEKIDKNKEIHNYLIKTRTKLKNHIEQIKKMSKFIKTSKKCSSLFKDLLEFKKNELENARFEKIKMFEKRGRIIMSIKNIELLLSQIKEHNIHIDEEKKNQLIFYRKKMIEGFREKLDLENRKIVTDKIRFYEEQIHRTEKIIGYYKTLQLS